jgi:hypothetical protein
VVPWATADVAGVDPASVTEIYAVFFCAATLVDCVAELFAPLGSGWVADTLAEFEMLPGATGVTAMVTVAFAPLARVPRLHVNVVVPVHEP